MKWHFDKKGNFIIDELSTSDHDADWIKELPGYREGEEKVTKLAAKIHQEELKRKKEDSERGKQ